MIYIRSKNTIKIPTSDFLHSIYILRSNLVKYGIQIGHTSNTTVIPKKIIAYNRGKEQSDFTQVGKTQDSYPLSIFSKKSIKTAILNDNWEFIYYSFPINIAINAFRDQFLANEMRVYLLETSLCFLMKWIYEGHIDKSPLHS